MTDALTNSSDIFSSIDLAGLWVGFEDEESMVAAAMGNDMLFKVFGGVAFRGVSENGTLPDDLSVAIRFHTFKVPHTYTLMPEYTFNNAGGTSNARYYYLGFTFIQDLIERAVAELWADARVPSPAMCGQMFPVPAYRHDLFAWGISRVLPLFMVLGMCL